MKYYLPIIVGFIIISTSGILFIKYKDLIQNKMGNSILAKYVSYYPYLFFLIAIITAISGLLNITTKKKMEITVAMDNLVSDMKKRVPIIIDENTILTDVELKKGDVIEYIMYRKVINMTYNDFNQFRNVMQNEHDKSIELTRTADFYVPGYVKWTWCYQFSNGKTIEISSQP